VSTAQDLRDQAFAYVVSDICDVVAGLLAIGVVVVLTRRHNERKARVEAWTPEPSPIDASGSQPPPVQSHAPPAPGYSQ
jgi:hypothetical protein